MSGPRKSARAVEYAEHVIVDFYADHQGHPYIDVVMSDDVRRTMRVRSREVRVLLDRLFYEAEREPLGSQARHDAVDAIAARAQHSGTTRDVRLRVAEHDGAIYIDIGDDEWRAARVDATGWKLLCSRDVPVRFRRAAGCQALPLPTRGGSVRELKRYIRADEDAFILTVAWLIGAFCPTGPYVTLVLSGEQGSSKSTSARLLRALVDPHGVPLRAAPREERDLAVGAIASHVLALDNLSYLPEWLSDCLCRIATGGGWAMRTLYTDDEETILSATRPVIITGISDVATRGDLADRAYSVSLQRIGDEDRLTEAELQASFEEAAPRIFGALLDALAVGIQNIAEVRARRMRLPRMADAAAWVIACEPALPWTAGDYLRAYMGVRAEMHAEGVAGDPVAAAIVEHVNRHDGSWRGTPAELLDALNATRNTARQPRGWPETARALSGHVTRLAPMLRGVGIEVDRGRTSKNRFIELLRATNPTTERHNRHERHRSAPGAPEPLEVLDQVAAVDGAAHIGDVGHVDDGGDGDGHGDDRRDVGDDRDGRDGRDGACALVRTRVSGTSFLIDL